jgi:hypothetical protein
MSVCATTGMRGEESHTHRARSSAARRVPQLAVGQLRETPVPDLCGPVRKREQVISEYYDLHSPHELVFFMYLYTPWELRGCSNHPHNRLPLLIWALHSPISVGTDTMLAQRIPRESENPIEPILNSCSCFARSTLRSVRAPPAGR